MEENKRNELEEETLKINALTCEITDEPDAVENAEAETSEEHDATENAAESSKEADAVDETEELGTVTIDEVEVAEIETVEVENVEAQDAPPITEAEEKKWHREKISRATKEKKPRAPKEQKAPRTPREPAVPISEPALPLLICAVVFVISLLSLIIDRFIYPFSKELLAPVILQLIALIVPVYLAMMVTSGDKSSGAQFKEIGVRAIKAEHIFFMIFTALFTMCASLVLTLMLGGAGDAARGITLLGTFTAGVNEYTVSYPYLILTYVLLPAVAEELLFRGFIFSRLEKVSFPLAATVSCVMCALYGFSLGGLIPSLFVSAMMVFVLYTTGSLVSCFIVHLLVNLYRLFLEANISAYFLSSQNNFLLLITVAIALAISALLFFTESTRIYRAKAQRIADGEARSANKSEGFKKVADELRSTLAFKPSLICSIICVAIFAAVVIINYLV